VSTALYRIVSLTQWPKKPTAFRKAAPWRATDSATRVLLAREMKMLNAKDVTLAVDCDPSQVRLDGTLRASARLRGPGVVLRYRSGSHHYEFCADRYRDWNDNLRAIAMTMELLRAVARYGATRDEAYVGFRAIPAATEAVDEEGAHIATLCRHSGRTVDSVRADTLGAFRAARARTHTDVGGNVDEWHAVERAGRALGC
jgi:hypothetical protein